MSKFTKFENTNLDEIISDTWSFMWKKIWYVVLPSVILQIINLVFWEIMGVLFSNILNVIIIIWFINFSVFFMLNEKKSDEKQSVWEIVQNALQKLPGSLLIFIVQIWLIALSIICFIFLLPLNFSFWIWLGIFILIVGIWLSIKLYFANYIYLTTENSIWNSIKASYLFSSFVGWWIVLWKSLVMVGMFIVITMVGWIFSSLISWLFTFSGYSNIILVILHTIISWIWIVFLVLSTNILYFSYHHRQKTKSLDQDKLWCLFYWCLSSSFLVFLFVLLFWIFSWFAINRMIKNLTTKDKLEIPRFESNSENILESTEKFRKIESFFKSENLWISWENSGEFILDQKDLNNFVYHLSSWELVNNLYFYISTGNTLHSKFSLDLNILNWDKIRWKYINWDLWFVIWSTEWRPDKIFVNVITWNINWKTWTTEFWDSISSQNILQDLYKRTDEPAYELIKKIKNISISWQKINLILE